MSSNIPVPEPENPDSAVSQFENFVEIVKILRRECPWDRKQTNESIAPLMIEEVYEAIDAIYKRDDAEFSKELGDLLLHIVMHAVMAEERGGFSLTDVVRKISEKMIHRHPHVFSNTEVKDEHEVLQNWEALKLKEHKDSEKPKSTLDGVPNCLPALLRAERIQYKVSRVGFDWTDKNDVWNKIYEEFDEFRRELTSGNKENARKELGDFIFAIVNAARHEGIVAEEALHLTNNKFKSRFQFIEKRALELGRNLNDMTLEEMDAIWDEAKLTIK
ncbi:MAG: nucleoside triphosphate pyrophosphohydrolase [Candidatus Kapabacteria bacterium]|nr:nucleoside triphosphate pyrophosphohydrolase [Ignavibacteriota bacterium]MCW5884172.1 nucleoside triphosphate pyrophosphohydrolase [Candidatus Kapabacteria bacterium]